MRHQALSTLFVCGMAAIAFPTLANAAEDAGALICQENPCTTDADCGAGMRCQPDAVTSCVTPADGGVESCGPATLCEPIWDTSCSQDSDCGDGFGCALVGQECDCGGSSGIDIPDGAVSTPCGDVGPTPPPAACDAGQVCAEPPSICSDGGTCLCWETKMCQQKATPSCTTAADCPSLFSCSSGACQPPCANLEQFGGGTGGGAPPTTGTGSPSSADAGASSAAGGSQAAASPRTVTASCALVGGPRAGSLSTSASPSLLALAIALSITTRRRRAKPARRLTEAVDDGTVS